MKKKEIKKKLISRIFFIITSVNFFLKITKFLFRKNKIKLVNKNFKEFEKKEINEILEFAKGAKSKKMYWHDSLGIFQEYFIPNHKNNHKPKILRTKSLVTMAFFLIMLKVTILSYVFFVNPFEGWMSEVIIEKVIELVNKDRVGENLQALTLNPALSASALAKANDMIEKNYFAHFTPDGKKPWDFIDRNKYPYLYVGENLAMNFTSADSVHQALMDSPTHKKNILNIKYDEIGIALVSGEINGIKTNILVEIFASKNYNFAKTIPKEVVRELPSNEITEVAVLDQQYSSDIQKKQTPKLIEEFSNYQNTEDMMQSPNNSLVHNESMKLVEMTNSDLPRITFVSSIVESFNHIFIFSLAFVIMSLILNVLVRLKIQHKSVVFQSLVLLIFIAGLIYWRIDLGDISLTKIYIL